jgi:hypothetical protein
MRQTNLEKMREKNEREIYQVPVFSRPLVMGTEMLEPIKDALVWLTESSGPLYALRLAISNTVREKK